MDPDANLREQLELAERLNDENGYGPGEDMSADAARLAELVLALDGWIRRGGFLPERWRNDDVRSSRG